MKRLAALLFILLLACLPMFTLSQQAQTPQEMLDQWYSLGAALREMVCTYVELRKGDKGYEVTALQTRLKELGYYKKEIVTNYGAGTESAMRAFEKVNRLQVNGWASVDDQRLLFMSDALSAKGTTVQPGGQYAQPGEPSQTTQAPQGSQATQAPQGPQTTQAPQVPETTAPVTSTPGTLLPIKPSYTLNIGDINWPTDAPISPVITLAPHIPLPTIEQQKPGIPGLPKPGF